MQNPQSPDRRRAPRVRADLPLTIDAPEAGAPAGLENISTNGLCCSVPEPIPEMTLVRVQLELDGERHAIDGAVVRCVRRDETDDFEVAVYFTGIPDRARARLGDYVRARAPEEAGA